MDCFGETNESLATNETESLSVFAAFWILTDSELWQTEQSLKY